MEDLRGATLRASGLPLDELRGDYVFVRLADLISLTFCTGWTDVQRFDQWTVRLSGSRVVVSPEGFDGAEIPIEIDARDIRNQPLQSDQELREALSEADTTVLRGMVTTAADPWSVDGQQPHERQYGRADDVVADILQPIVLREPRGDVGRE